ncbi:FAD-dependent oxidoreductase [Devosia sp. A449]
MIADVLIVGAGLAGLSAANRAAELGLSVCVLEAGESELYACNSRISGGLFHITMDDMVRPADDVVASIARVTRGEGIPALASALGGRARFAIDWLREQGVTFMKAGPDGLSKFSLAPPRVRRTGLHWRGRAGDVMLRTLVDAFTRRGGRIELGHEALRLIMRAGRCEGVIVRHRGVEKVLHARAVLLCDGGFQADHDLLAEFVTTAPERLLMRNARTGRGAGIRMARAVGAQLVGMAAFYGHLHHRDAMGDEGLWPFPVLDSLATAGILVDSTGNRFCDEGLGGISASNAIARLPDPLSTYLVFDAAIWNGPGQNWLLPANPYLLAAGGTMVSAPSIDELASQLGLPPERLTDTVSQYNLSLRTGAQLAVPRTNELYEPWPISKGPFYAVPICAGITYTMGGILTDEKAQVLDEAGHPIEGLLAAGATTGGLEGGSFAGYSGGLSKASVFGIIAAETLAASLVV